MDPGKRVWLGGPFKLVSIYVHITIQLSIPVVVRLIGVGIICSSQKSIRVAINWCPQYVSILVIPKEPIMYI